ncbi:MAG: CBS domain-containing protein [Acidimicrobiales bacterium]
MQVADILARKGTAVATVAPDDTVRAVVAKLKEIGVGALVVSANGTTIDGIVSERDIVRRLDTDGADLLDLTVDQIMTRDVVTCSLPDRADGLLSMMTGRRIRHLPVIEGNSLAGIVSIGDVVKSRLDELVEEAKALEGYIQNSGY